MVLNEQNLKKALEQPLRHGVYYYYSTEEYLVRSYAAKTLALLAKQEDDAEVTRVEGPAPSIEEAVAAAGTISFFGTKRIVELPMLEPSAMNEADVGALCDLMQSLENAVLVMSTVFKDDKAKLSKKAKQLIGAAEKAGLTAELVKPGPQDAKRFAVEKARELGAVLSPGAASELVERCGTDLFALESELSKLAAVAGYGEITPELIAQMGTQSIEADVFEMVRLVTARNKTRAMAKLSQLLELQNEPIHQIRQLHRVVLAFYDDHFFHAQLLHRRSPICITSQRAVCSSTVPSAADDFNAASSPSSTLRMCSSWARE